METRVPNGVWTARGAKAANAPSSAEVTFRSLLRAFGLMRQVMEPHFARLGISGSQWAILRILQRAETQGEGGLRVTDLGTRLLVQPPSVTGVVDRLERQGLVKRSGSKTDMRVKRVELTAAGRKLVIEALGAHRRQIDALFAGFKPQDLQHLGALLNRFEAHLGDLLSPSGEKKPVTT